MCMYVCVCVYIYIYIYNTYTFMYILVFVSSGRCWHRCVFRFLSSGLPSVAISSPHCFLFAMAFDLTLNLRRASLGAA